MYNFRVNGLAKFGTQNHQKAIDLLVCGLTDTEQNYTDADHMMENDSI
jgi:hypothetical protein